MSSKKVIGAGAAVVVILAVSVFAWWYASLPHTPEAAFALADKAEQVARADASTKKPEEVRPEFDEAIEKYRAVGRFGKTATWGSALDRIAKMQREYLKDEAGEMATLDELVKGFPADEGLAGGAMIRQAQIIRAKADSAKAAGDKDETKKRFEEALAKLEGYRKAFARGKRVDETLLETGKIWQLGIGTPLIKAIDAFEKLIKEHPGSEYKPEAMFRLGSLWEQAREFEKALAIYAQLADEFPKSKWAEEALWARGNLLKDKMDREAEAAEALDKLAKEHPESDKADRAKAGAEEARGKAAVKTAEEGTKARYGGSVPVDTTFDKPVPPWEELQRFAKQKLDAQKYEMDIEINPADHRMIVTGTLSIVNKGDAKDKSFLLMLAAGFSIQKLTIDGEAVKFTHDGETLAVAPNKTIAPEQAFVLGFEYAGQFAGPMSEHDGDTGAGEERIIDMKDGTKKKFREVDEGGGKPMFRMNMQLAIGKEGYGLSGGMWYPGTVLGDLFEARTTFHVPAGLEAVASGGVEKRTVGTGGKAGEFVFKTARPVFGIYFAYGTYSREERTVGPVKYITYLRAANAGKSAAYVEVASRILNLYGEKFVTFPYEKMAIIETPLPPFLGGVGPSSMMMLSEKMVTQKDPPEFLLAHELAHQWFGNLIPINIADEGYSQWLSEGFATYCDALYTEHQEGHEKFVNQLRRYAQTYFQTTMAFPSSRPTVRNCFQTSPLYRPVVYEKGALVLHALRKVMGDEKFFALMREYVKTYQDKQTTVGDFEKLATKVHGQDLAWFFKEWLDEPSFALWTIKDVVTEASGGSAGKVTMKIEQPRDLIKMPVDITLIAADGRKHVAKDQMLDQKEQTLEVACPFSPAKIIIDEENWVLHHPGSLNTWPPEKKEAAATGKALAGATSRPGKTAEPPAVETMPSPK